jgi:hypothetical protein
MALAEKALRGAFYPISFWELSIFSHVRYGKRSVCCGTAIGLSSINISQGDKAKDELLSVIKRIMTITGAPGSNMEVSEAELKQLEANVRQLELHVMKEIELQSAESVSRDAHVQYLIRELGRMANAGTEDERVEEREKQLNKTKGQRRYSITHSGLPRLYMKFPTRLTKSRK